MWDVIMFLVGSVCDTLYVLTTLYVCFFPILICCLIVVIYIGCFPARFDPPLLDIEWGCNHLDSSFVDDWSNIAEVDQIHVDILDAAYLFNLTKEYTIANISRYIQVQLNTPLCIPRIDTID